ncbi:MAG: N(4)-(beta-N-acetylglucosaminyl)-L-asparaginase [Balneola sp.]|nr:N(4)-(beta-N-acetylglucosaminyl)-L-asparaginase [Balneola sp.]MBO6651706.1 N(4)-(beta-N-acetylglucosaminyl)-L-asparaginase [Balneola sp.]MBO6712856.1 N(4)-(beta-N-acetylglucosaminyl)-L-asparaginase [Balneola sp.]MBO6801155.1 N(4)-(beta-N-acetylglucosaminyl)-L-asparaginase [Balneola sp.]MBO6871347.1 N(4)-(beta-N-acetylglucosaminyl)-L-asparaginase [Balneola sp.]
MLNRKQFLKTSLLGAVPLAGIGCTSVNKFTGSKPVVIATWNTAIKANLAAWEILDKGGYALDAVEAGVRVEEDDPENMSVGYGGRPDREGIVSLDACIMDDKGECGAVVFLQNYKNPVSVARKVMEETPHIMLAGDGAQQFAKDQGFEEMDLLTPKAKEAWEKWLEHGKYEPEVNIENHDTIGMLALDAEGKLSGACTTSGAAWKMHGRVGDSPLIGAGLFVDPEIGAACATGLGEEVVKTAGSALIVEMMRQGHSPEEACKIAVDRIISRNKRIGSSLKNTQVGYLALNKDGAFGAYSIQKGFDYGVYNKDGNRIIDSEFRI